MIQRIQTIYLLIGLVAWGLLFFNPVIGLTDSASGAWLIFVNGIKEVDGGKMVMSTVPMLILFILVEILGLVAVLSYGRRAFQLRVTVMNMLLQFFSYGIIAVYVFQGKKLLNADAGLLFWSIMPLIAGISSFLAFRGIRRDILLLRAQDRLR